MRVDKFLKVSRILKRRSVSKELAIHQRILVNDKLAKPSTNIEPLDIITITFGRKVMSFRVLEITQQASKHDAQMMYEVVSEHYLDD
ncbi:MAG: RNA-binding S4 domain-containing protein [Anaerorhabdus sp.]